jgi:hypothetical protein
MHWHVFLEFVDECAPTLTPLRRIGASHAMHEFC